MAYFLHMPPSPGPTYHPTHVVVSTNSPAKCLFVVRPAQIVLVWKSESRAKGKLAE